MARGRGDHDAPPGAPVPPLEAGATAPTLPQKAFPESMNSIPIRKLVGESGGK